MNEHNPFSWLSSFPTTAVRTQPFEFPPLVSKPIYPPSEIASVGILSLGWRPPKPIATPKPKVFVSYHHRNDQWWYDHFSELFAEEYDLFSDTSIERKIESDDSEYQSRFIRENHITGSSITIVLCGSETAKRKHVDWEIHATLERKHALLGIILPTHTKNWKGQIIIPDRLLDNVNSGYARWMHWSATPQGVAAGISVAKSAGESYWLIRNSRAQLGKNLP